jgi:iron complex transport system ATP-binding protein
VSALVEARGLSVRRGERTVLEAVELRVEAGEGVAVVGPNAAGKSTLLRALCGLIPPAQGEVRFDGRELASHRRAALARAIALVAAEEEGPDALRVKDRVALGRYPHVGPFRALGARDLEAVERAIARTGISELAERALATLSAGERQLATLARGLAQEPRALLLDEPAAHLDVGHELRLFRVLDEVRAGGVAVVAVVHDLARAALWAPRMVLVDGGRIVADGPPDSVLLSDAAAKAFGVRITSHEAGGRSLYSFEEAR